MQDEEDEDEDDDEEWRAEPCGVAVEEHNVPAVVKLPEDDGITGEVLPGGDLVLPDAPGRVEARRVRHRGHQGSQQEEVLPQGVLRRWLRHGLSGRHYGLQAHRASDTGALIY